MNKKLFRFFMMILLLLLMVGCMENNEGRIDVPGSGDQDDSAVEVISETAPERKLIYKVDAQLETEDLEKTLNDITGHMTEDERIYERHVLDQQVTLLLRIKSSRLETFLDSLSESGKVGNLNMTATDVSLAYQDKTNRITSLNAERARLVILYEEATMADMVLINERISEIDREVMDLQGTLNEYDSLIDYSEVTLYIYEVETIAKQSFLSRIGNGFEGGFKALITFLEDLLVILVTMLPFMVVLAIIAIGALVFHKSFLKRKSQNKK